MVLVVKNPGSVPGLGRLPEESHGNPLQYSCLENLHGQKCLVGYSPWGHKELDTTEELSTHAFIHQIFSSPNILPHVTLRICEWKKQKLPTIFSWSANRWTCWYLSKEWAWACLIHLAKLRTLHRAWHTVEPVWHLLDPWIKEIQEQLESWECWSLEYTQGAGHKRKDKPPREDWDPLASRDQGRVSLKLWTIGLAVAMCVRTPSGRIFQGPAHLWYCFKLRARKLPVLRMSEL